METTSRPDEVWWTRSARLLVYALSTSGMLLAGTASARVDQSRTSESRDNAEQWWVTEHWTIHGESIVRRGDRIRVEQAVARYRRADEPTEAVWQMRADHLEARISVLSPHRMRAFAAEGRVRIVGPEPLYVAGQRAGSWAPGRTVAVWNASRKTQVDGAHVIGDRWTLAGEGVSVDFYNQQVTVDEIGSRRRSQPIFARNLGS